MSLKDKLPGGPLEGGWKCRPEILLSPSIPTPMSGLAPRVVLGKDWWDITRLAAYESTGWHCQACEQYKRDLWCLGQKIEAHEIYEIDFLLGQMVYVETVPLCTWCHAYVHRGRFDALVKAGKTTQREFDQIIRHGDAILKKAGLKRSPPYQGPIAEWSDWRLVIGKKEYKPLYPSFRAYLVAVESFKEGEC